MSTNDADPNPKAAIGIKGLDAILTGGLPGGELHLLQGSAGTGKTTIGLQFVLEGAALGEKVLFITFAQTKAALRKIAAAHGWSLDGINIHELTGAESVHDKAEQTLFHTADVELGETTDSIFTVGERLQPDRIVLDSVTSLRLLAADPLRYRRQLLTMRKFFSERPSTVLFLDGAEPDLALETPCTASFNWSVCHPSTAMSAAASRLPRCAERPLMAAITITAFALAAWMSAGIM